jgi:hypothetical protein
MNLDWQAMYSYYLNLKKHPDGDFYSCAIRLSMSLHRVNAFNKATYRRGGKHVSKNGWAKVAEELYQHLRLNQLGAATMLTIKGHDSSQYPKQNGIVYLRDCFTRAEDPSDAARTGDHIDLFLVGKGLLSAIRFPEEFKDPFYLLGTCRDGKVRFWPAA